MAKKTFINSIEKTNIASKTGIGGLFSGSQEGGEPKATIAEKSQDEVRQTFIIQADHLERLRDYVHLKRQQGDSLFTQKEALQEALELLFKKAGNIPSRPDHIKEAERIRSSKIKRN